jgi:hypothetical protein
MYPSSPWKAKRNKRVYICIERGRGGDSKLALEVLDIFTFISKNRKG